MSGEIPEPFVPPGTDVSDLDGFMLNVERLLASELVAIATPEQCWAAFMLWCRAWKQIPAGSLPNDERVLASFSGAGKRWDKVKGNALHGFVLCSDGRFYHRFLCAEVMRAVAKKAAFQERRERDAERLRKWRETRFETRVVAEGTGQGQGRDGNNNLTPQTPLARGAFRKSKGESDPRLPAEHPWEQRLRSWAKGHRWNIADGPEPGQPGCCAPADLVKAALEERSRRSLNGAAA